jgi:peptide/nickel transport system substrate-binding protein
LYDAGSGQLVFNSYETLIAGAQEIYYDFEPRLATNVPSAVKVTHAPVSNTSFVDPTDPDSSLWDAMECVGYNDLSLPTDLSVGDVMYMLEGGNYYAWYIEAIVGTYTITFARWTYTFTMRTSPVINFYDETGAVVDTFDVADAEYSFKRGLVQDQLSSPQWMFYKPLFGTMNSNPFDSVTDSPTAMTLANLIDDAIGVRGNDLIFSLGIPFPDNAWKQILTNTWGSIVSKQFSISIGCWNGDLLTDGNGNGYPDWWDSGLVRRKSRSPYDATGAYRWVGTGPYHIAVFDSANLKVDMLKNPGYWRGWPATGRNGSLDVVEIQYIADWTTRKTLFQAGDIDTCAVPRANMFELLDVVTKDPPAGVSYKTIKNILPGLTVDAIHPTFDIDPTSYYIGTGHFPDGIPTDFFNNTHIRKAFAYSFNSTQYAAESYYGEADYRKNFLAAGLFPDYYNDSVPGYSANLTAAELELQAATFPGVTGSVWDTGFRLTLCYNTGNDMRRIACEMIRDFFVTLSTYDGRSPIANPFIIDVANIDWSDYVEQFATGKLPIWSTGWSADFADADSFARPYMHSNGDLAYLQGYTADNGWGTTKDILIDQALLTPDGPARQAVYDQLAAIYYDDCPSYPLTNPRGRRWCQYWVKGWYYNAMYPSDYYYCMCKLDTSWCDISGPIKGVPDGRIGMPDVSFIISHYGARAPEPGKPLDPKWVGTYGMGCADVYSDRIVNALDLEYVLIAAWGVVINVQVTYVGSPKTIIGLGYGGSITTTVSSTSVQNFNVTIYANASTLQISSFNSTETRTLVWNTTGFSYGNYTILGAADIVHFETEIEDNNYTCTTPVHVGVPGDVSGPTQGVYDGTTNMRDVNYLIQLFNTYPTSPNWKPNADINNDGTVNMRDIQIAILNFNKYE